MAHELISPAQQQEISAGGLLAGLFLLMVVALGGGLRIVFQKANQKDGQ